MFIDLGKRVSLTDEQFQDEMRARVAANPGKDVFLGCPLCGVVADSAGRTTDAESAAAISAMRDSRVMLSTVCRTGMAGSLAGASAQSLELQQRPERCARLRGWEEDADGTKYFLFGYMNRNWEEELDIPVGPDNGFIAGDRRSGAADALPAAPQPFRLPREGPQRVHREGRARLDAAAHGKTEKAYATLRPDYKVDDVVKASETGALGAGTSSPEVRANKPPVVKVEGPKTLTVKVGQPVTVAALVTDDGIPKKRAAGRAGAAVSNAERETTSAPGTVGSGTPCESGHAAAGRATVGKNVGLHLSWFVYRGPGPVTFDPPQIKAWEDTRAGANSPWAPIWVAPDMPADGKVPAKVTFSQPGHLRAPWSRGRRRADG